MTTPARVEFLGLHIADLSLAAAMDAVFARMDDPGFDYVVTPNVDHVVRLDRAGENPDAAAFANAYADAWLVLCDSRVLARLARLEGKRLPVVPGSDLTPALLADRRMAGRRVAVVGGAEALLPALRSRFPAVDCTQHRPPMGVLRNQAAQDAVEAFVVGARADLIVFAIGAPQSEIVAQRCRRAGRSRGVALCSGASLEFIVGDKRRAPVWVQQAGMEWAFRLGSEPRRLWRRYLVEGPRVFAIWARHRRTRRS